jgi:SAM-dependent methyltransferase
MKDNSGSRDQVDVAAVLRDLKAEVRRQRHELRGAGAIAAEDWLGPASLDAVQSTARVNPHLPIAWPEWPPGIVPKVVAVLQKVTRRLLRWYINPIVAQQNEFNTAAAQALVDLAVEMRAGHARVRHEAQELRATRQQWEKDQERERQILAQRLWRLEQQSVQRSRGAEGQRGREAGTPPPPYKPLLDYYHFELRHRGSLEDIAARQRLYLDYFEDCRRVLDIGCGRGEFVALLRERGIDARGVEIDAEMVAHCQAEGLPVEHADALSYLATLRDESLDGVFMAQVVEHLVPADLVGLLRLCRQKLAPDGVLVAETINPTCVYAFVQYYLMDPSHVQPLHPETLRFMLEDAGFWQVEIKYLSPVPAAQRLSPLSPDGLDETQVSILNRNVERLNALLFGHQDYAAIARRPPEDLLDTDSQQGYTDTD